VSPFVGQGFRCAALMRCVTPVSPVYMTGAGEAWLMWQDWRVHILVSIVLDCVVLKLWTMPWSFCWPNHVELIV
jgi:hypothetical protein